MKKKPLKLEAALKLIRDNLYYVVQSKELGGIWRTWPHLPPVKGQDEAYDIVRNMREQYPEHQWRVLKKDEADLYTQGLKAGRYAARHPQA
jgi:hypothetical protein